MTENNAEKQYTRTLTIAGSDSGGGAGIQADLKAFSALGCYGMSVITALTAQNTVGVTGVHPVPADFVADQMTAVFTDIGADAVKLGMLFSPELIQTVAEGLKKYHEGPVVLDPVMVATSGDKLLEDAAIDAVRTLLLPLASLVTPNIPEAEVLLERKIHTASDIEDAAQALSLVSGGSVLIKGGHLGEDQGSDDYLYLPEEKRIVTFGAPRVKTRNTHGTGCTLSSAITAFLARGESMEEAVGNAKAYIHGAIEAGAGYRIGEGHGPVHHFYEFW